MAATARKAVKRAGRAPTKRVASHATKVRAGGVSPGDTVEWSMSLEIKGPSGSLWLKGGVTSQVRPGEGSNEALERVQTFVEAAVRERAELIAKGVV